MASELCLSCFNCQVPLLFASDQPMWLYSCGHLNCSLHAQDQCCSGPSACMDVHSDEIVSSTYSFLKYLQSKEEELQGDYVSGVMDPLLGLILRRIQELAKLLALCQTDAETDTSQEVAVICPTCSCSNHADTTQCIQCGESFGLGETCSSDLSAQAQVEVNPEVFYVMETLTQSEDLKNAPWECPRLYCKQVNRSSSTTCVCGYVNLKKVVLTGRDEPPASLPKPAEEEKLQAQHYWKCSKCTYEYNFMECKKCTKCEMQQTKAADPKPPAGVRRMQVWACSKCKFEANPEGCTKCTKCNNTRPAKKDSRWECLTCTFLNKSSKSKCEMCKREKVKQS